MEIIPWTPERQKRRDDEWDKCFIGFYSKYIEDAENFLSEAYKDETGQNMVVDIYKFISLADKAQEIPMVNSEHAQIFMLVSMGEAIYRASHPRAKVNNCEMFTKFIEHNLQEDAEHFKFNFQRSITDKRVPDKGVWFTPKDLAIVLYDLRSQFTHESFGYELHFAHDHEYAMLSFVTFHGKRLALSIRMQYQDIRDAFARMAIRCVRKYIES